MGRSIFQAFLRIVSAPVSGPGASTFCFADCAVRMLGDKRQKIAYFLRLWAMGLFFPVGCSTIINVVQFDLLLGFLEGVTNFRTRPHMVTSLF